MTTELAVIATNSRGTSVPAASQAVGAVVASRVNHFCNVAAAYTDLTTGPHLCGWPDSTNTGYQNAPGYPGGLTVASSSSSTCPTTLQSNQTYSFCQYNGRATPSSTATSGASGTRSTPPAQPKRADRGLTKLPNEDFGRQAKYRVHVTRESVPRGVDGPGDFGSLWRVSG